MRLYVPLTIDRLAAAHSAGKFEPPLTVYAVTPALREWYAAGDEEELEYAAMAQAARASIGLIAALCTWMPRRRRYSSRRPWRSGMRRKTGTRTLYSRSMRAKVKTCCGMRPRRCPTCSPRRVTVLGDGRVRS